MKLHRKIEHNEELHRKIEHYEKVCRAQELGSYAQGQGHNRVKSQIVPNFVLLIHYWSKFDRTSQKIKHNEKVCHAHDFGFYAQGQGCSQVRDQNHVSAIAQKLLKQIWWNFTEK